jgi:hypothetical protein
VRARVSGGPGSTPFLLWISISLGGRLEGPHSIGGLGERFGVQPTRNADRLDATSMGGRMLHAALQQWFLFLHAEQLEERRRLALALVEVLAVGA